MNANRRVILAVSSNRPIASFTKPLPIFTRGVIVVAMRLSHWLMAASAKFSKWDCRTLALSLSKETQPPSGVGVRTRPTYTPRSMVRYELLIRTVALMAGTYAHVPISRTGASPVPPPRWL